MIEADGAPRPQRHVVLMNPVGTSPYTAAAKLFRLAVGLGLRTIAFTKARRVTELIYSWVIEAEPQLRDRISSYRAGFLPEERREIEQKLFSGALDGVISTSALEMGIDVGGLDVCILVGYPGSQMATWQRAGRVGRAQEGAVVLIAQPDALDQYLVAHPRMLFERGYEHAVVDPNNAEVATAHLPCAADELPLRASEAWLAEPRRARQRRDRGGARAPAAQRSGQRVVRVAAAAAPRRRSAPGRRQLRDPARPRPGDARSRSARSARAVSSPSATRARSTCTAAGSISSPSWISSRSCVRVRAVDAAWFTRSLSEKETEILSRDAAPPVRAFQAACADGCA